MRHDKYHCAKQYNDVLYKVTMWYNIIQYEVTMQYKDTIQYKIEITVVYTIKYHTTQYNTIHEKAQVNACTYQDHNKTKHNLAMVKVHYASQWRCNGRNGVSNHQPRNCLFKRLFTRRSKKISKLRITGLCEGNSPVTGEFLSQRASNAESVSIWWRHHVYSMWLTFDKSATSPAELTLYVFTPSSFDSRSMRSCVGPT